MQNRKIEEYLNNDAQKIERLKEYNSLIGVPMNDNCILSLVLPAHNESENIIKTIQAVERQEILNETNEQDGQYEVLIVVNNSNDDTYAKAINYLQKSTAKVPVYVVNIDFEEREKGVGSARKFGTDLELYRMYSRAGGVKDEHYFVGGDADEQIPRNHLKCIVKTFRESYADLLLGEFGYNYEAFPKDSDLYTVFKAAQEYRYQNRLFKELFGGNHALTADLYLKVGGYANKRVGEDTYLMQCAEKCGASTAPLPSEVMDNPRRMLVNPLEYLTHEAWDEKIFLKRQEDIRAGVMNCYHYKDEEIKGALTIFIDDWSIRFSMNNKLDIQDVVERKRRELTEAMENNMVRKELFVRNDLFYEHNIVNYQVMRKFMPKEEKYQLLFNEKVKLEELCKEINAVPGGYFAEWIQNDCSTNMKIPLIPELEVHCEKIEQFTEKAHLAGYELFQKQKIGNHSFLEKVFLNNTSFEAADNVFWLVKVNSNGIIVYQAEPLGRIRVFAVKN